MFARIESYDAKLTGYIKHLHAKQFTSEQETWDEGSTESKIRFSTAKKQEDFKKLYNLYSSTLRNTHLNIGNIDRNHVRRLIARLMNKRDDINARIIGSNVYITATQEVIDKELASFEFELMNSDSSQDTSYNFEDTTKLVRAEQQPALDLGSIEPSTSAQYSGSSQQNYGATKVLSSRRRSLSPTPYMRHNMREYSFRIKNTECIIYVYEADISRLSVDIIMCPVSQNLDLTRGVARSVATQAGDAFKDECRALSTLNAEGCEVLTAGSTDCNNIIVLNPGYRRGAEITALSFTLKNALGLAMRIGADSVAVPMIGTSHGLSVEESVTAIYKAVQQSCSQSSSLQHVHLVGKTDTIEARRVMKSLSQPRKNGLHRSQISMKKKMCFVFSMVVIIGLIIFLILYFEVIKKNEEKNQG